MNNQGRSKSRERKEMETISSSPMKTLVVSTPTDQQPRKTHTHVSNEEQTTETHVKKQANEPDQNDRTGSQNPVPNRVRVTGSTASEEVSGRERLKRHRVEVAGQIWVPDMWGQEELLKDWIDCTVFDASLRKSSIMSARAALVEEGRRMRANSGGLRIENRC